MQEFNFEDSIAKFLTGSISSHELDACNLWLEKQGNEFLFRSYTQIDFSTKYIMSQYDAEEAKKQLLARIRRDKSHYHSMRIKKFFKYAAVGLLFLMLGYSYNYMGASSVKSDDISPNVITLQLSDGTLKTISEEGSTSILNRQGHRIGLQKGNQLIYHQTMAVGDIAYNSLTVPYGKRFAVILSDGTKAYLNAGSSLRYPTEFVQGENREVFLSGEGYFKVAKNTAHPFIINVHELDIKVLGTEFNISGYPEDEAVRTVLVEGSVELDTNDGVGNKDAPYRMKPGFMAIWQQDQDSLDFQEIDVSLYTGWMDGKMIFRHTPFKEIIKVLERNYNVSITNEYSELNKMLFTASFDTETISQVLEAFGKNYPLRFTVGDDGILIQKP